MEKYYPTVVVLIIVFSFLGSIPYWGLKNMKINERICIWWKTRFWRKFCAFSLILSIVLLVGLFIMFFIAASPDGFVLWKIKTEEWAFFGTFIGAIFLFITLMSQIRTARRQQIETKFFEMVRYYRDNLTEMRLRNPFYYEEKKRKSGDEYVVGREVIKTIFDQYRVALKLVYCEFETEIAIAVTEIKTCEKKVKPAKAVERIKLLSNMAYHIVYWGTPHHITQELKKYLAEEVCKYREKTEDYSLEINLDRLISEVKKIVVVYECKGNVRAYSAGLKVSYKAIIKCKNYSNKIKFFRGQQFHLAHFFRHINRTLSYIDNQASWLVSPTQKVGYIDIFRAQISNYEQALLFINSMSCLGGDWEHEGDNDFITDYNLIRNLPAHFIPIPYKYSKSEEDQIENEDMKIKSLFINPNWFYPQVDFEWEDKMTCREDVTCD